MNTTKSSLRKALGYVATAVLVIAAAATIGGCRKRRGIRVFHDQQYVRGDRRPAPVVVVDRGRDNHRPAAGRQAPEPVARRGDVRVGRSGEAPVARRGDARVSRSAEPVVTARGEGSDRSARGPRGRRN